MEANKENVHKEIESRIPLPLHPLPPLPVRLLKKKEISTKKRQPLQTLAQENVEPSTSNATSSQEKSMIKILKNLDTKFVTMRRKSEEQDTDYNIFNDHDRNIIIISDDDEEEEANRGIKDGGTYLDGAKLNCDKLSITPSEKQGQHLQVRNIKRSLRRPSSRELQGLSPPETRQEEYILHLVRRRLQFTESPQTLGIPTDSWINAYERFLDHDYTDDILKHLLATECPPTTAAAIPRLTRACLINWLLKVNGPLGNRAIVQTACWYLDSILSKQSVSVDKFQLVAMACYWIAEKLHGPVVLSSRYTKISGYAFTQAMLTSAEKLILVKLAFPPQPVIPQEFISYLAWWCDKDRPGEIEVAANLLCMSGMMVVKELSTIYPSVIACAAVATALKILRGKDAMKRIQECPVYKTAEKKAGSILHTCKLLRVAVRTVTEPWYEYKVPIEHYRGPPHIAQHIVNSVQQC